MTERPLDPDTRQQLVGRVLFMLKSLHEAHVGSSQPVGVANFVDFITH
jgi:hypothetical protein